MKLKSYEINMLTNVILAVIFIITIILLGAIIPTITLPLFSVVILVTLMLPLAGLIPIVRNQQQTPSSLIVVGTTLVLALLVSLFEITILGKTWGFNVKALYVVFWVLVSMLAWRETVLKRIQKASSA